MRTLSPSALALAFLFGLVGCVPSVQYTLPPTQFDDPEHMNEVEDPGAYRRSIRDCGKLEIGRSVPDKVAGLCDLAIIEFDDHGEFWEPVQLDDTLDLLHERSTPEQPALVVVFVHGWKNNASPRNERRGNLRGFSQILVNLAEDQIRRCGEAEEMVDEERRKALESFCGRPVVGVYMAWRGKTFVTPVGKSLSYFNRRAAAERVARVSFSHAIHRLVNHAKGNKADDRGNPESVVVVVGHSLGGLILENTLLRSLTAETNDFAETFPVDLAVLVNSANDAILTRQFLHALENAPSNTYDVLGRKSPLNLPLIVSVTSRGDWATGALTPISQALRGVGKAFRKYGADDGSPDVQRRQTYYYRHTAGHTGREGGLLSHAVECPRSRDGRCGRVRGRRSLRTAALEGVDHRPSLFEPPAIETVDCSEGRQEPGGEGEDGSLDCVEKLWFLGQQDELYQIRRLPESPSDRLFWVIELPKRIVPDHSGIFQSEFVSLLGALVNLPRGRPAESLAQAEEILLGEPARVGERWAGALPRPDETGAGSPPER